MEKFIKWVVRLALVKTKQKCTTFNYFFVVFCYSLTCFVRFCDGYGTCRMVTHLWSLKAYTKRYSGARF
jgi:hypothetical protein